MAKAQKMAEDAVECVDLSSDDENADTGKVFIANFFEFENAYESACIFPVLAKEVHIRVLRKDCIAFSGNYKIILEMIVLIVGVLNIVIGLDSLESECMGCNSSLD